MVWRYQVVIGSITLSAKFTSTGVKQNIGNISSVISDPDLSNNQSDNTLTIVDTSGGGTYSDLSIVKDDTAILLMDLILWQ
jgi:hypothetical protein